MSDELFIAFVAAGAAVVGSLVGMLSSFLVSRWEHERRTKSERAAVASERRREAALQCDRFFRELASDVPNNERPSADVAVSERIYTALEEIELLAVDLPGDIHSRVLEAVRMMRFVDEMGCNSRIGGTHYSTIRTIARTISTDMHALLSAFLRNEDLLPEPVDEIFEYREALAMVMGDREQEFAQEIYEDTDVRRKWLEDHPDVKRQLEVRRQQLGGTRSMLRRLPRG